MKVARESLVVAVGVAVLPSAPWLAAPAAWVTDFVLYEYVLEPWSKARVRAGKPSLQGPYWESGPQDGERFVNE